MTTRLVRLATRQPRWVLAAATLLFLATAALGVPVTGMLGSSSQDFQDPASQYERAHAVIAAATGQTAFYNVDALVAGRQQLATDPAAQPAGQFTAAAAAT